MHGMKWLITLLESDTGRLRLWSLTFTCAICALLLFTKVEGQPGLSLDCGARTSWSLGNITWIPDSEKYVSNGSSANVSASAPYNTLRYFPDNQIKHCYVLPTIVNQSYIMRAGFYYGNYDNNSIMPSFELLFGATSWTTVNFSAANDTKVYEMVMAATGISASICLARTNASGSTPFISSLEIRALSKSLDMYSPAHQNYHLKTNSRINFGQNTTSSIRYPDDEYDRIWESDLVEIVNITMYNATKSPRNFTSSLMLDNPPSSVLQTARTASLSQTMTFNFDAKLGPGDYYLAFYFAEVVNTMEQRIIDVYIGQTLVDGNRSVSGALESAVEIYSKNFSLEGSSFDLSLRAHTSSMLGPILNAAESYLLQEAAIQTEDHDVRALSDIQEQLNLTNWEGDPCSPPLYKWSWLTCNYSNTPRVITLNLSGMGLRALFPPSIANLSALTVLDLHDNDFYGIIPSSITTLTNLRNLDLRNNNLSGDMPVGLRETNISASGNAGLCMPWGELDCDVTQVAPVPSISSSHIPAKSRKGLIGGLVAAGLVMLVTLTLGFAFYRRRYHGKKRFFMANSGHWPPIPPITEIARVAGPVVAVEQVGGSDLGNYSFADIRSITNDFEKKCGGGSFGTVFYGVLPSGHEVVVKLLQLKFQRSPVDFHKKVSRFASVHHRNLLKPIGFCAEYHRQLLILEYMQKGSLYDHLYDHDILDWRTRLNILLQVAQGLEYLHVVCSPSIVHGNIKSTNVLLNDTMVAKVMDFGLHELSPDYGITVDATSGYLDPEYFASYELTKKSDVYSFGVLLLEVVCGRSPLDTSLQKEQWNIVEWVNITVKDSNYHLVVDPSLQGYYNHNALSKVVQIALQAIEAKASKRPTMVDIVAELKEANKIEVGHHVAFAASESSYLHDNSPTESLSVLQEKIAR